jgi:hypothetical protein
VGLLVVPSNTVSVGADGFRITVTDRWYDIPTSVTYVGPDGTEQHFVDADVARATTPVGDWYTVTVAVDQPETAWSTLVSVLVPVVGFVGADKTPKPVSTVAVRTVQHTDMSMPGPQISAYTTFTVTGEALR